MAALDEAPHLHAQWTHQVTLDKQPQPTYARAFVCDQLVAHRLFHMVDLARVVAGELARIALDRLGSPVLLRMTMAETVLLLRVQPALPVPAQPRGLRDIAMHDGDTTIGSGVMGVLTVQWGVTSSQSGTASGLWAALDARRHRHSGEGAVPAMDLTDEEASR